MYFCFFNRYADRLKENRVPIKQGGVMPRIEGIQSPIDEMLRNNNNNPNDNAGNN